MCINSASAGHQPFGANNQSGDEVAAAGLFVGHMQADPPQSSTIDTPFSTTPRSDHIPVNVEESDVIRLGDSVVEVEEEEEDKPVVVARKDIVLAEGWSPVLYK